ncbi:hypothetical protein ACQRXC_29150 (plasmid) [Niallia taxi]|uniref:hypothetical protein n=1 Tax=Niallia taxi TaxID=2499688 RepID=UPI003F63D598
MKKSYSSLNVLSEKMTADFKGMFHSIFAAKKYITVKLPYYDYLRGQVFIEDVKDNYPEEISSFSSFNISQFVYMLYLDFMKQIKRGVKNEEVANYLSKSMDKYFPVNIIQKRVFNKINNNLFQYEEYEIEEDLEEVEGEEEKYAYLTIRIQQKVILRGEILLHDLAPFLKGKAITVEQLMAIIYLDFIKSVKENGNSVAVQQSIVKKLQNK